MRLAAYGAAGVVLTLAGCASSPGRAPSPPRIAVEPGTRPAASERPAARETLAERIVRLARTLLDTPYRYGGSDPRGFDCSGLTSYLFLEVGFALPRTAVHQARAGSWVALDELRGGDLVFFEDGTGKPDHVGLVASPPGEPLTMIHASESRGVIETEVVTSAYWLERLRFGRRVLE